MRYDNLWGYLLDIIIIKPLKLKIMLAVEIIILIIAIIGLVFAICADVIREDEAAFSASTMFFICGMLACIVLDLVIPHGQRKLRASNYQVKTEIQVKSVNGKEISRDTVYIFTPKKK
jgi:membrane protein YdbS with pleckstrin-like domain